MAEEAEKKETQEQETAATGSSSRKKIVVLAFLFVLVIGAGAPVGFFLLREPEPIIEEVPLEQVIEEEEAPTAEEEGEELALQEGEEAFGAIVPLETFLVNLKGGKYIRLQVQAEMETPDVPKRFYSRVVPVRDEIIAYLTEQTAESLEQVEGKDKLKLKVKEIMNQNMRREDVRRVYFTQFVIQ
jgi:flagellar basal body-associated protein FliL